MNREALGELGRGGLGLGLWSRVLGARGLVAVEAHVPFWAAGPCERMQVTGREAMRPR